MREVSYSFPVLLVLWAVLGYFVYGGMDGALAMILLSIVLGLAVPVALIPFVGFIEMLLAKPRFSKRGYARGWWEGVVGGSFKYSEFLQGDGMFPMTPLKGEETGKV